MELMTSTNDSDGETPRRVHELVLESCLSTATASLGCIEPHHGEIGPRENTAGIAGRVSLSGRLEYAGSVATAMAGAVAAAQVAGEPETCPVGAG